MTDKNLEPLKRDWRVVNGFSPLVSKCRQLFWELVLEKNCNDFSWSRFFWMQTQHADLTREQAAVCARDMVRRKGDHLSLSQPGQHTSHWVLLPEALPTKRPLLYLSRVLAWLGMTRFICFWDLVWPGSHGCDHVSEHLCRVEHLPGPPLGP